MDITCDMTFGLDMDRHIYCMDCLLRCVSERQASPLPPTPCSLTTMDITMIFGNLGHHHDQKDRLRRRTSTERNSCQFPPDRADHQPDRLTEDYGSENLQTFTHKTDRTYIFLMIVIDGVALAPVAVQEESAIGEGILNCY